MIISAASFFGSEGWVRITPGAPESSIAYNSKDTIEIASISFIEPLVYGLSYHIEQTVSNKRLSYSAPGNFFKMAQIEEEKNFNAFSVGLGSVN